jgi:hypothetical protein
MISMQMGNKKVGLPQIHGQFSQTELHGSEALFSIKHRIND